MTDVLCVAEVGTRKLAELLARYDLVFVVQPLPETIKGSYWGDREAGIIGKTVFARADTPVHSVLHEACHVVCMTAERRRRLYRDAGGDDLEESATCFLQILLADSVDGVGRERLMADMDSWGYSFRLGSARDWFESDAEDARQFLVKHALIDQRDEPTWRLRS